MPVLIWLFHQQTAKGFHIFFFIKNFIAEKSTFATFFGKNAICAKNLFLQFVHLDWNSAISIGKNNKFSIIMWKFAVYGWKSTEIADILLHSNKEEIYSKFNIKVA